MFPLLLLLLLVPAGTYLKYRLSSAYKAKQRAQSALSSYEATDTEVGNQKETLHGEVEQIGSRYIEQIYSARLKSIPVDALKKYAAGLRLQALKDSGIRSIADLQGWSEYRVSQVRGVGPKSAGPIVRSAASIIAASRAEPITHPAPPFADDTARQMMQALYRLRWFEAHIRQQEESFRAYLLSQQAARDEVAAKISFSRWLWKLGANTTIRANVARAEALTAECDGTEQNSTREALSASLEELRGICSTRVSPESILGDFQANYEFYESWLTSRLGKAPMGQSVVAPLPAKTTSSMSQPTQPDRGIDRSLSAVSPSDQLSNGSHEAAALVSFHIVSAPSQKPQEFALPQAEQRAQGRQLRWIPKDEAIEIQGRTLRRGFVYYGKGAETEQDYALNPWLSAKSEETLPAELQSYSQSYLRFSPSQRSRYLDWLASGADSPSDTAFGMTYFYGLERRLLEWLQHPPTSESSQEKEDLIREIERLRNLFQLKMGGVADCCIRLLDFAAVYALDGVSPVVPPTLSSKGTELPLSMRYGIGCFMRDSKPIPVDWAFRWVYLEPMIYLRTAATRCPEAFEVAFAETYTRKHGDGLFIRPNKTCLRLRYQPGWPLHFGPEVRKEFLDIPDVAAISGPVQAMKSVVDDSTNLVDGYSRYLGRNPTKAGTLEALLHLPMSLWPTKDQDRWQAFLTAQVLLVQPTSLKELLLALGETGDPALAKTTEIVAHLGQARVGFEPDIQSGARRPKPNEFIVLFPLQTDAEPARTSADFKRASVTVSLSACVALADGHVSEEESAAVEAMIDSWQHLPEDSRTRLRAQYKLQVVQKISLASVKSRFSTLPPDGKMQLAQALSTLASVDGNIAANEVKLLEQVYRALDLEPQLLYSHLHGRNQAMHATGATAFPNGKAPSFAVDASLLAALRQETEQVSLLLANVFMESDETTAPSPATVPPVSGPTEIREQLLPGLDPALNRFVAEIVQKPSWSRGELEVTAARFQIMLDGALERINEAAFDFLGEPLTEGDDPVYVQQIILEMSSNASNSPS